ncbi:MAG: tRNA (adenosine(37)-N6)-threonylcarbamoyltransferase complex dimerization subunit type 1 TsaB [Planctomycetes bacterium]|nr:tRNA (adenosine(37)-N6)-threonylcarbamoyltransferase complex dimerization subunit type 1 TsaB [Planctomycetota bacterium]
MSINSNSNMRIVGIETSGMQGGIALLENETVKCEIFLKRGMVHGKLLVPALDKAIRKLKWRTKDIGLVAVDIGPGSYTGLRVGLAVAKTMAYVLKTAIIGVASLDAMAVNFPPSSNATYLCPMIDAKWRQVYTALYKKAKRRRSPDLIIGGENSYRRISNFLALQPEELVKILPTSSDVGDFVGRRPIDNVLMFGDGLKAYHDVFKTLPNVKVAPRNTWFPKARHIALLGYRAFRNGKRNKPETIVPLYLRPTEAEINRRKKPQINADRRRWRNQCASAVYKTV